MTELIDIEAFAGPGGWSEGRRIAGATRPAYGIEWDMAACRTAVAAGHPRVRADVATFPLDHLRGRVDGAILSPPCQAWSNAGDQLGKLDQGKVHERIAHFARGETPPDRDWADERSMLTAEPMRWAYALRPRWIALEQVPPVLPLWQYTAELLRGLGYRAWTGILSAEQYGVPQTRKRAILIARSDGISVGPPEPTHQPYRAAGASVDGPDLFGGHMPRPKSWATLLEWTDRDEQMFQLLKRLLHTQGIELTASTFRALLDEVTQVERQSNGGSRAADEPSLTITASLDNGNMRWAGRAGSVPMTVREAALLQSFRADYPWRGTKEQQHRQVGDAMPPLFAAAILRPLIQPNAREAAA